MVIHKIHPDTLSFFYRATILHTVIVQKKTNIFLSKVKVQILRINRKNRCFTNKALFSDGVDVEYLQQAIDYLVDFTITSEVLSKAEGNAKYYFKSNF